MPEERCSAEQQVEKSLRDVAQDLAEDGEQTADTDEAARIHSLFKQTLHDRMDIAYATGIFAERFNTSIDDGRTRLQAFADRTGLHIVEAAHEIVRRQNEHDPDGRPA